MKEVKVVSSIAKKKGFGASLWDYLTTVDHKKIAILYLVAGGIVLRNRWYRGDAYTYSISKTG